MTTVSASRRRSSFVPLACAAAGLMAVLAPSSQAVPLSPLDNPAPLAPASGAGGPKRPGVVVAPKVDPEEANLRQGGPRRPGVITPSEQQTHSLETSDRLDQF